MEEWSYDIDGKNFGPVKKGVIEELIRTGELDGHSLVWRKGLSSWVRIRDVPEFQVDGSVPPPKPISHILSNPYLLGVVFLLVIGLVLESLLHYVLWEFFAYFLEDKWWVFVYPVLYGIGCWRDYELLSDSLRTKVSASWWIGCILVPVYLYLRGRRISRVYSNAGFIMVQWPLLAWFAGFAIYVFAKSFA